MEASRGCAVVVNRSVLALALALLLPLGACTRQSERSEATAGPTFAQLEAPVLVAHRGGGAEFPENTLYSMDHVAPYPTVIIDADVQRTASGALILNHDDTLDRTSRLSGPISGYTETTWQTVPVRWPSGSTWQPQPAVFGSTWKQLADKWGGKRILSVEGKTPGASSALIADVVARGIQSRVVFNSFSLDQCRRAVAAGIPAVVTYPGVPDLDAAEAAGVWGVSLYAQYATRATLADANRRGLKVLVLQVSTQKQMESYLERGAYGFATDYPFVLLGRPAPSDASLN
jgi:glycerophosphoryl diester phosphodiesterase